MTVPLIERFPRTEQAGNVLQTTLATSISTTSRPVTVTPASTVGWPTTPAFRIVVDGEIMLVTYISNDGLTWRAETTEGTTAATHSAGATVTQVLTSGALQQMYTDHRAVGSPTSDPHPMYLRPDESWMTKEWGLVGDGVADDTDALQNAIDTLTASGGGTVWLKPGTFIVRGLTLKTGVTLRGSGMYSTVIKLKDGANQPVITCFQSPDAVVSNAFMVGVMDLMIHGNRTKQNNTNTAHGIVAVTNPLYSKATNDYDQDLHHIFQNVHIRDVAGVGVWMYGRGESRCINVHVIFGQSYGFYVGNDSFLSFCTTGQTASHGFVGVNAGSGRLVGCKAFYAGRLIDQGIYPGNINAAGFWFANCFSMSLVDCEAQDCAGQGFFLEGSHRMTFAGCVADSNSVSSIGLYAGFHLYGSDFCTLSSCIAFERRQDGTNSWQQSAIKLDGGDDHNDITLTHSGTNGAVIGTAIYPGSTLTSSSVRVNGNDVGLQIPAFVTPYTPDPYSGQFVEMTLTGNITVSNPTTPYAGQQLTFVFIQDATGTRTVTWGTAFKVTWTPTTTANRKNTISFVYDGTNWIQISSAINLP